ncbi:sulfatase-like hydrolase/transferase [Carboxylicivirga sediminis]|uniref:Sulfatase-like hydrolase/transferase n=1 Tax=Carboxylicivirga sediminis TaxID=2006564 RepID=A0A941F9U0_9BACT|nr:alkaline phosphatase family protein [Carboxylicivirga sediminis]MBR8537685.1 sulfatase-like hydrolase/transferase [Carboxylicivirga sediminis]
MKISVKEGKQLNEYLVLTYRLLLIMAFYSAFRILFYLFNTELFPNITFNGFLTIMKGGLLFDLSAMLYLNGLYALLFLLPLPFKFHKSYQIFLKTLFVLFNSIGLALNSIDLIYYRFILKRTTYNVINILENETNMTKLWGQFIIDYWYVAIIFIASVFLLAKSYSFIKPRAIKFSNRWFYPALSVVALTIFTGFSIVGMRGGYRHSTRPINMANAGKYVNTPDEMAIVLNTPFCMIRTWGKKSFTAYDYFETEEELNEAFNPLVLTDSIADKPKKNIVIFILESFNKEFLGSFNPELDNGNYKGYTPFLDSLAQHALIFPNTYANGRKSIDAMPSILASIPALVLPYVVSEYSSNHINGLPFLLKKDGYNSAFFHGAPNGSMGFDSFANVANFDAYKGMTEFNNDDEFDGMWGIWDEPFFQFFANEMNKMQEPFMTSVFSLSSHHPFKVPDQYTDAFPKGTLPVHQGIGYTDYALRKFFESAKQMPWYSNTLFVITADHSTQAHYDISQTSVNKFQIPLILYSPGDSTLRGVNNELAQQIDIMPTLLNYIGFNKEPYIAFGKDLLHPENDRFAINYTNNSYQMVHGDYVLHYDGENLISAFNIAEDPYLKHNLKNTESGYKNSLPLLKGIIQQYNNRMIEDRLVVE